MRCTRCDHPAIPQAVGFTTEGAVVFGWCVACLEETGCREIEIAARTRRRSTKLVLPSTRKTARPPTRREPMDDRRQMIAAAAGALVLWGVILSMGGAIIQARQGRLAANPLGNGTPAFLIGGGRATAAVGFLLWAISSWGKIVRSRPVLKGVQVVGLILALDLLVTLAPGQDRSGSPIRIGLAVCGVAIAVAARWIEVRPGSRTAGGRTPP